MCSQGRSYSRLLLAFLFVCCWVNIKIKPSPSLSGDSYSFISAQHSSWTKVERNNHLACKAEGSTLLSPAQLSRSRDLGKNWISLILRDVVTSLTHVRFYFYFTFFCLHRQRSHSQAEGHWVIAPWSQIFVPLSILNLAPSPKPLHSLTGNVPF